MDEKNTGVSPWTLIPEEMWGLVFANLNQNEVLNARLVCQGWKEEINRHYTGFNIHLDDKSPDFELFNLKQIQQLRVTKCKVIHLVKPSRLGRQIIFKFPDLITKLDITHNSPKSTPIISRQNLHFLLKTCSKNLKVLDLSLPEKILNNPYFKKGTDNGGYVFPKLECLKIIISAPAVGRVTPPLKLQEKNVLSRIVESTMPKLYFLGLTVETELFKKTSSQLAFYLLSHVAKYAGGMLKVVYSKQMNDTNDIDDSSPALDLEKINFAGLKKVDGLDSIFIHANIEPNALKLAWELLMRHQKKLRWLKLYHFPILSTTFQHILDNNSSSICRIEIGDLALEDRIFINGTQKLVFDMAVFQNCFSLQYLKLRDFSGGMEQSELLNFSRLPTQLQSLTLFNFSILSDELLEFNRTHRSLTNIAYFHCGSWRNGSNYGVNGTVMQEILLNRALEKICILGFNPRRPGEQAKLRATFTLLGNDSTNFPFAMLNLIRDITGVWKKLSDSDSDSEDDAHY